MNQLANETVKTTYPIIPDEEIRALGKSAPPAMPVTGQARLDLINRIKKLLIEKDAVLVAHYYTDADLQMLAEETGGFVSDSLDMAKFGKITIPYPFKTLTQLLHGAGIDLRLKFSEVDDDELELPEDEEIDDEI